MDKGKYSVAMNLWEKMPDVFIEEPQLQPDVDLIEPKIGFEFTYGDHNYVAYRNDLKGSDIGSCRKCDLYPEGGVCKASEVLCRSYTREDGTGVYFKRQSTRLLEPSVGHYFELEGSRYRCDLYSSEEDTDGACYKCALRGIVKLCAMVACTSISRRDKQTVFFVKADEAGPGELDYAVGHEFDWQGKMFRVCVGGSCEGCDIMSREEEGECPPDAPCCQSSVRFDGQSVYFEEVAGRGFEVSVFSDPACPAGYNWATVDSNGQCYYTKSRPHTTKDEVYERFGGHAVKGPSGFTKNIPQVICRNMHQTVPSWVSPGRWVTRSGHFYLVKGVPKTYLNDMLAFPVCELDAIMPRVFDWEEMLSTKPARVRPYKPQELIQLMGKPFYRKSSNGHVYYDLLISVSDDGMCQMATNAKWSAEELLTSYKQLDGTPCGCFQVQDEDGMWIDA